MAQALTYAQPPRSYRRWFWSALVIAAVLGVSYWLAVPRYRTFRAHQIRRGEIRQQFTTQLQIARQSLDSGQVEDAAVALLRGEFPVRIEANLFRGGEIADFYRQISAVRNRVERDGTKLQEALNAAQRARRAREDEEDRKRGVHDEIDHVIIDTADRERTLDALSNRAAEALRAGNSKAALGICEQILTVDPMHQFGDSFWTNAPSAR